jgi:hypothetical protein
MSRGFSFLPTDGTVESETLTRKIPPSSEYGLVQLTPSAERTQVGLPSVTKKARYVQIESVVNTADPGFREYGRIEAGSKGRCK